MAKYLRPRRGTAGTAVSQNMILKNGELFFELPTGSLMGKTAGRIVMGDGYSVYGSINYSSTAATFKPFITDPSLYTPVFTNSTYATSGWTYNAATSSIDKIGDGTGEVLLPTIISAVKETLCTHEDSLRSLNNDISSVRNLPTSVSNLATSVSTLNTNVTNLNSTVSTLSSTVNNLKSTCSNLVTTASRLTTSVSNLNSTVSNLSSSVSTLNGKAKGLEDYKGKLNYRGRVIDYYLDSLEHTEQFINDFGIATGQFNGLRLGDEIIIQNKLGNTMSWTIVGFDHYYMYTYYWRSNDNNTARRKHHVVLMCIGHGGYWWRNDTSVGTGGYYNSFIRNQRMLKICDPNNSDDITLNVGDHLLEVPRLITNGVSSSGNSKAGAGLTGYSNSSTMVYDKVCAPSEVEIFGRNILASSYYDELDCFPNCQFEYFKDMMCSRAADNSYYSNAQFPGGYDGTHYFWTRTIGSYNKVVAADPEGNPALVSPDTTCWYCPVICLG